MDSHSLSLESQEKKKRSVNPSKTVVKIWKTQTKTISKRKKPTRTRRTAKQIECECSSFSSIIRVCVWSLPFSLLTHSNKNTIQNTMIVVSTVRLCALIWLLYFLLFFFFLPYFASCFFFSCVHCIDNIRCVVQNLLIGIENSMPNVILPHTPYLIWVCACL